jgi:hypothetical protein
MISSRRSAHERSETTIYVETQHRLQLNITNANSNVDQEFVNSNVSKSKLSSLFTIFTSSSFSHRAFFDDKIIITARKTIERKQAIKKMSRIKKRKIVHKVNTYFYDSLYDSLFSFRVFC